MNMRRMVDQSPASLEAQLLRAGRALEPSEETVARVVGGLNLPLSAFPQSPELASPRAASEVVTRALGGSGSLSGATLLGGIAKWGLMGALLGVSASGGVAAIQAGEATPSAVRLQPLENSAQTRRADGNASLVTKRGPEPHDSTRALSRLAPPTQVGLVPTDAPHLLATAAPAWAGSLPQATSTPSRSSSSSTVKTAGTAGSGWSATSTSLGDEVSLIDQARRALVDRQPELALSLLARHTKRFQSPRLGEEAAFLRARTLVQLGRTAEAAAAARRFRADYPASSLLEALAAELNGLR